LEVVWLLHVHLPIVGLLLMLQRVAVCCRVLQRVLQVLIVYLPTARVVRLLLLILLLLVPQCVAVCCSVLQRLLPRMFYLRLLP